MGRMEGRVMDLARQVHEKGRWRCVVADLPNTLVTNKCGRNQVFKQMPRQSAQSSRSCEAARRLKTKGMEGLGTSYVISKPYKQPAYMEGRMSPFTISASSVFLPKRQGYK